MRLFFALNLDEPVKDAIERITAGVKADSLSGNFTSRENLHVTLAFLGEVNSDRVPALRNLLLALPTEPFPLIFSHLGSFGRERSSQIVWIGMNPEPRLFGLADHLRSALRREHFPIDEKPFVAHLTLGREIRMQSPEASFQENRTFPPISFHPRRISLMESTRLDGKLCYREIFGKAL